MISQRLTELERIIETKQTEFYKIGKALKQIRDERLFRDVLFDTFEAYVKKRWDISKSHAYRLIEAFNVIDNLSPIGDGTLPENESQTRILTRYSKEEQRKIWRALMSSGKEMNTTNIREVAQKTIPAKHGKESKDAGLVNVIGKSYKEAVMSMLEQIRLAKAGDWETTSKQAALFWLCVMKDNIESRIHHEPQKG